MYLPTELIIIVLLKLHLQIKLNLFGSSIKGSKYRTVYTVTITHASLMLTKLKILYSEKIQ